MTNEIITELGDALDAVDLDYTPYGDSLEIDRGSYRLAFTRGFAASVSDLTKPVRVTVRFNQDVCMFHYFDAVGQVGVLGFDGRTDAAGVLQIDPRAMTVQEAITLAMTEVNMDEDEDTDLIPFTYNRPDNSEGWPESYTHHPGEVFSMDNDLHYIHSEHVPRTPTAAEDQCLMPVSESARKLPALSLVQMPYAWGHPPEGAAVEPVFLSMMLSEETTILEANALLLDFYRFVCGRLGHEARSAYVLEQFVRRRDINEGSTVYTFHHGT